ncbi:VOC family protein [Streptomyces sp. NPDC059786]|uniref:VOC family protein n=1 Tax=Streptomyces sp. NPDC059786 TaxID=3346946 RepID=UPI00365CC0E0
MNSDRTLHGAVRSSHAVAGAPCWVSLSARDLAAAQRFYAAVLGWEWSRAGHGDQFRLACADGVPVAGAAEVAGAWQTAVAWTPYFAVADADEAVSRGKERGGTPAVGPIAVPSGRAALLADRDGAVFGVWEGALVAGWEHWRESAPAFVRLHTRDAFDAAIFYGEVLRWASGGPGSCEVVYDGDEVVLSNQGDVVARIFSGALGEAPDPTLRPHWQVVFAVPDVAGRAEAAVAHGGGVVRHDPERGEIILSDPDGARFTVTARPARK